MEGLYVHVMLKCFYFVFHESLILLFILFCLKILFLHYSPLFILYLYVYLFININIFT